MVLLLNNITEFEFPVLSRRNDDIIYFFQYLNATANELLYVNVLHSTLFGTQYVYVYVLLSFKMFIIQYAEYIFLSITKL